MVNYQYFLDLKCYQPQKNPFKLTKSLIPIRFGEFTNNLNIFYHQGQNLVFVPKQI